MGLSEIMGGCTFATGDLFPLQFGSDCAYKPVEIVDSVKIPLTAALTYLVVLSFIIYAADSPLIVGGTIIVDEGCVVGMRGELSAYAICIPCGVVTVII